VVKGSELLIHHFKDIVSQALANYIGVWSHIYLCCDIKYGNGVFIAYMILSRQGRVLWSMFIQTD